MFSYSAMSRERVRGVLRTDGTRIVNGAGEEFLPVGVGLGNWLLWEGYMWRLPGRFDRPRTIESLFRELTGDTYTEDFIRRFREIYITEADVAAIAAEGFNSVRVPIEWHVLMENAPGFPLREEGFVLLERFLDWCETHRLYVFLDMHGAPGGQTGANIDNSWDSRPRLFSDPETRAAGIRLWEAIARRFRDRWIVGGYDLLNEPLRPEGDSRWPRVPDYRVELASFYRDAIAAIRAIDPRHMIQVEGRHWASTPDIFTERWDDNYLIHFHRYWCPPEKAAFVPFLAARERLGIPVFLGETGENRPEWYAAMLPLALSLGIGYNFWPWKKMECTNSPCSIRAPKGWAAIQRFARGGARPTMDEAVAAMDGYLENARLSACDRLPGVAASLFRRPGAVLFASDFDEGGCEGHAPVPTAYRRGSGMRLIPPAGTSGAWDSLDLVLAPGEWAQYTFTASDEPTRLVLEGSGTASVSVGGACLAAGGLPLTVPVPPQSGEEIIFRVTGGEARVRKLRYE